MPGQFLTDALRAGYGRFTGEPSSIEYAAAARAQAIARMSEDRQIATLVAFAREYEVLAQDDTLDLLIAKLLNEARDEGQRERLKTLHDLDRAALTLARACELLLGEADDSGDVREAIFAEVPREDLAAALATIGALGRPLDEVYYTHLVERYRTLRWFLPTLLATLHFQGVAGARDVLVALDFLASIEGEHAPDMSKAPLAVVGSRWRPLVIQADGQIDRKAYTFSVLDRLRTDLRIEQVGGRHRLVLSPLEKLDEPDSLQELRQRVTSPNARCGLAGDPPGGQPLDELRRRVHPPGRG